jgi:hypothetical protein
MDIRHIAYLYSKNRLCPLRTYAERGRFHSVGHAQRYFDAVRRMIERDRGNGELRLLLLAA